MYGGKLQRYEVVELAMHREDFTLTPKTWDNQFTVETGVS